MKRLLLTTIAALLLVGCSPANSNKSGVTFLKNKETEKRIPKELLKFLTEDQSVGMVNNKILFFNFDGKKINDQLLSTLLQFDELEVLILDSTEITDTGLITLAKLSKLKALWLDFNNITEKGLDELQALENLIDLDIENINIADNNGLKCLGNFKALKSLEIINNGIGDECIESIIKIKNFRR